MGHAKAEQWCSVMKAHKCSGGVQRGFGCGSGRRRRRRQRQRAAAAAAERSRLRGMAQRLLGCGRRGYGCRSVTGIGRGVGVEKLDPAALVFTLRGKVKGQGAWRSVDCCKKQLGV